MAPGTVPYVSTDSIYRFVEPRSMSHVYDSDFMDYTSQSSRYSAQKTIAALSKDISPVSVLDVGCARGTWLQEWAKAGIADYYGVDGEYVDLERLDIPRDRFLAADLSKPFQLSRKFELVQSLEVAEHVAAEFADVFVENLTRHASGAIFFSAAPPGQGGEFHVNEQPFDYWRKKFARHGYSAYDYVRPLLANDRGISFWYRFNPIVYLADERAARMPDAVRATHVGDSDDIADVSPTWFKMRKRAIRALPFGMQQSLARLKARLATR